MTQTNKRTYSVELTNDDAQRLLVLLLKCFFDFTQPRNIIAVSEIYAKLANKLDGNQFAGYKFKIGFKTTELLLLHEICVSGYRDKEECNYFRGFFENHARAAVAALDSERARLALLTGQYLNHK